MEGRCLILAVAAMSHLQRVLSRESVDGPCLDGYLDLVVKEAVLKRDRKGMDEATAWGLSLLSKRLSQ